MIPALVVLILALFVIRPVLTQETAPAASVAAEAMLAPVGEPAQQLEKPKTPLEDLHEIAAERRLETANVLKSWLAESGKAA